MVPGWFGVLWAASQGASSGDLSVGPWSRIDYSASLLLSVVCLAWTLMIVHSGRRLGYRVILVGGGYFLFAAAVTWVYVALVLNQAMSGRYPEADSASQLAEWSGIGWSEAEASPTFAVQIFFLTLTAAALPGPNRAKALRFSPIALSIVASTITALIIVSRGMRADAMILSASCGSIFAILCITLAFHTRSVKHSRKMQDSIGGLLALVVAMFFYMGHPEILLIGTTPFLALFALVQLVDTWFDPRQLRVPEVKDRQWTS
jgi:hypothetical protein